jgi:hypothetical protein
VKISEERPSPRLGCAHHWPPSHRATWIPTYAGGDWTIPECKRCGVLESWGVAPTASVTHAHRCCTSEGYRQAHIVGKSEEEKINSLRSYIPTFSPLPPPPAEEPLRSTARGPLPEHGGKVGGARDDPLRWQPSSCVVLASGLPHIPQLVYHCSCQGALVPSYLCN